MKAAPFTYHRPSSVEQALEILSQVADEGGRILAGGQSLMPMMALRMAYPPHLVDINEIPGLERAQVEGNEFVIGALTRHETFTEPVAPGPLGQLLVEVSHHIAHYPIRQRGTFCGSIAHADPASEWCLLAATLGGTIVARKSDGVRTIPAEEFFVGVMSTTLEPDEMVFEVRLAMPGDDHLFGFEEFTRRAGDLALAMSLAAFRLRDGRMTDVRVGLGGVEDFCRRIPEAEAALEGQAPGDAVFRAAGDAAASVVLPLEDIQTDADYRRDLTRVVIRRALERAWHKSQAHSNPTGPRSS
jgi:carbon-monoxide dehydrogenase medium subunit